MPRKSSLILLFSLVVLAGAAFAFYFLRPNRAADLTLFFTCDLRGRLVPCGCFTGQHGGITRLSSALQAITSRISPKNASKNRFQLRLDVGDAIRGNADFNVVEYEFILEAFRRLHFDALNMGHREASLSLSELQRLQKIAPAPLLSANLLDRKNGKPLLAPSVVIDRNGFKIGIVGVLDPAGMDQKLGPGLALEKMELAIPKILGPLKKEADFLVLLAFADETALKRLAEQFFEFHLILGGKVSQPSQQLLRVNRSVVLYTANESRSLGLVEWRLEPPRLAATKFNMLLLHDKIPEDPAIAQLGQEFRDRIRSVPIALDNPNYLQDDLIPGVQNLAQYSGSESCAKCHPTSDHVWKNSRHAHAFQTLLDKKADADPNCLSCHTVGFGTPTGYQRRYTGSKLIDVGCESCHGPGSLHVAQHENKLPITFKFRPLSAGDCKSCHYGEFSPPFSWDASWPLVKHGREPHPQISKTK